MSAPTSKAWRYVGGEYPLWLYLGDENGAATVPIERTDGFVLSKHLVPVPGVYEARRAKHAGSPPPPIVRVYLAPHQDTQTARVLEAREDWQWRPAREERDGFPNDMRAEA